MQGTLLDSETPITKLILNDWIRAIPRGLESGWQILKKKKKNPMMKGNVLSCKKMTRREPWE